MVEWILIALVLITVLFIIFLIIRSFKISKKNMMQKKARENYLMEQLSLWEQNYSTSGAINDRSDLFGPSKMKNGLIEMDYSKIECRNYTKNVPWFYRL